MKLSELLNSLLDRGFNPRLFNTGQIVCRINLDFESFGFTLSQTDGFLQCTAWSSYAGQIYFDRCFPSLNEAIFAAQLTAAIDDARLTEAIADIPKSR